MTSAHLASHHLDQSAADLVLLSTSLEKSKNITDKLSKMLTGFDDRLSRLEKSLAPIHNDTRTLTRINANIDRTILAVDQVLGNHDAALRQEIAIQNGPDPNKLGPFMAAVDEVAKSAGDLSRTGPARSEATLHIEKLLKKGTESLGQVFLGWVQDSTGPPLSDPIRQTAEPSQPLGFSTLKIGQLSSLYIYLKDLATSTGNSNKIDPHAQIVPKYAAIRSKYVCESLKPVGSAAIESMRNGDGAGVFLSFVACLFDMFNVEHQAILAVFKGSSPGQLKSAYAQVVSGPLELLSEIGQAVNSVIKRSLSSYIGAAFDIYAAIADQVGRFDEEVRRPSGRSSNELGDLLHAFKGSCLRSLPEYVADTKAFGEKLPVGSEASNTLTSEMTIGVVEYLKMLANHAEIVESLLVLLGDGNWIFPGSSGTPGRPGHSETVDGPQLLVKYLNDALSTLYTAIDARSKNLKLRSSAASTITSAAARAGVGSIYQLNNLTYIRRELLESTVVDVLGESLEEDLNRRVRTSKVRYLEIWAPLISALMDAGADDGKSAFNLGAVKSALPGQQAGAERRDVKDRFGRFNDAFEEVLCLHKNAKLDRNDVELMDRLRDEIERMIVPTYAKFAQRHEGGQFSKNPSKYLKMTAEQLEEKLDQLFQQ